jgi:hydrophobic/amphiphilic exporter-1 (mainly G- bacteria), HAE1 family
MESRSLLGVSIIKAYFQPGTSADADVTQLSNLALADLKRLPPGTLPPLVLKFDASSLPVCLVTVKGEGLKRNPASRSGAVPDPQSDRRREGRGNSRRVRRQVPAGDGLRRSLQAALAAVERDGRGGRVNDSNLILPAGDVKIGPTDYYVYSNSLVKNVADLDSVPIKTVGTSWVSVGDVGEAKDASQLQYNIVRIDGQKSAYIPHHEIGRRQQHHSGGERRPRNWSSICSIFRRSWSPSIVFDQSVFVKQAINTVLHEGAIGLVLTSLMILLFLGSMRATGAVLLSIPISALAAFVVLYMLGSTINTMILGGLALAFSRVIDNSVISLENIYRHLEMGSSPASRRTGRRRSEPGGAGRDAGRRGRFFPGHVAVRRQQVSVFRAGAGVRAGAAGFLRGRDDGDSAVLLALSESDARWPRSMEKHGEGPKQARSNEDLLGRPLQRLVQSRLQ